MNYLVYIAAALVLSGLVLIILPFLVKKTGRDSSAVLSDVTLNVPESPASVQPAAEPAAEQINISKPEKKRIPAPEYAEAGCVSVPVPVPEPEEALISSAPVFYPERDPQEEPVKLVDIRDLEKSEQKSVPSVPASENEGSSTSSFFPLKQHREEFLEDLIFKPDPKELTEPKEEIFGGDREGVLFLEPEFSGTIHNEEKFSGLKRIGRGDIIITENGVCFSCGTRIYRFDFHKLEGLNTGNRFIELRMSGQKEGWLIITAAPADLIGLLKEKYSLFLKNKE